MIKITEKPWGRENLWALTDTYAGKLLQITAGKRLSKQFHKDKEETILVIRGKLILETWGKGKVGLEHLLRVLEEGESFHIEPGTIHRFGASDEDVLLVEVSTTELCDVVRLEDDFGRVV